MKPTLRVLAVVPCYNEAENIANVVAELGAVALPSNLRLDILVVNDCSIDNSLAIIRQLPCLYLALPVNLGIGGAMQAGYKYAFRHGYDMAVQVDGDGQHPAQELPKLLAPLLRQEADVVIGSRFVAGDGAGFQSSVTRRMGIAYFRWLNQALIGKVIHDSTSGFRAFNRQAIALANAYYPDEYPEPEAIVQFGRQGLRLCEVPVQMRERQGGISSINTSRALYYMFKVTLGTLFVYARLLSKSERVSK